MMQKTKVAVLLAITFLIKRSRKKNQEEGRCNTKMTRNQPLPLSSDFHEKIC